MLNQVNATSTDAEDLDRLEVRVRVTEAELRKNIRNERIELQRRLDKILAKATESAAAARRTGQALMDAERAAQTSGRNATAIAGQTQTHCKHCGNKDGALFVTDGWNADLICRKCGNVVRANQIQDKDWSRVKTSDDGKVMSSIGDKHDKRFSESHNLRVNFSGGQGVSKAHLSRMQRAAAYLEQTHHQDSVHRGQATGRTRDVYKDKDKRKIFERLEDVSARVGINMGVCNSAKDMYADVRDDREAMHNRDKMAVVCLFKAWQNMVQQNTLTQEQMLARAAQLEAADGMPPPGKKAAVAGAAADEGFSLMSLLGDEPPAAAAATASGAGPAPSEEEHGHAEDGTQSASDAPVHIEEDDVEEEDDSHLAEGVRLQRRHARLVAAMGRHTMDASTAQGQLITARAAEQAWKTVHAKDAPAPSATVSAAAGEDTNPHTAKAEEAEMRVAAASAAAAAAAVQEAAARTELDAFTQARELRRMAAEEDFCRRVSHPFWASYDARVRQVAAMRRRNQRMRFMDMSKPPPKRTFGPSKGGR